jgi:hypothetical protein
MPKESFAFATMMLAWIGLIYSVACDSVPTFFMHAKEAKKKKKVANLQISAV